MDKPWYKKWWAVLLILILAFIAVLAVAFGFYIYNSYKNIKGGQSQASQVLQGVQYKAEGDGSSYWTGSASPKVVIVEFADYNCPLCKNSYTKIREIGLKYKKDVKIIHRDLPILENSLELSLAGRCAGEQGLFWLMHDKLFQNQGKFTIDQLPELANQIGADKARFNQCLSDQKYLPQIKKDFSDAENFGITGTPTWFINGYKVEGDIPYNLFIQIVENLLK
ncbi:hypothetical protein COV49_00630 [Candidatus Falkowbacteria bacterium CG11_big_fil_rev_8_21_14_0_20_39_10]|uniref:Thioredoxin domain-containing protein n=1 Tax=Candidatus Falkowbacteria bacterium CG11_big_fil_rev_8_21_14_0_20_39_10 TaxID=1974570 RepID=A0A2M6KAA6_9BACT|nr:MAG: hypothetical protein COV49_00630 [Candidatus Falkowbacteria bacterium CG11_big_fil_rev_8_21_14_0_20_39_10]